MKSSCRAAGLAPTSRVLQWTLRDRLSQVLALAVGWALAGCAATGPAAYDPLEWVPASFSARYPTGTQTRAPGDLVRTARWTFQPIEDAYKRREVFGGMCLAIALLPSGAVAAVEITYSSVDNPAYEARIVAMMRALDFGPAPGTGYFVFGMPVDERSSYVNSCKQLAR